VQTINDYAKAVENGTERPDLMPDWVKEMLADG
jgi:hypothetical protein